MAVAVAVVAAALAAWAARGEAAAWPSCAAVGSTPLLVALQKPCAAGAGAQSFVCAQRLPLASHQNDAQTFTTFSVIGFAHAPARSNASLILCVGLEALSKRDIFSARALYLDQDVAFARDLPVGVAEVDPGCWEAGDVDCPVSVRVLRHLLELPPFAETPDVHAFWRWSGQAELAADADWLLGLRADGEGLEVPPGALLGLRGTSLRVLTLRRSFFCAHEQSLRDVQPLRHLELTASHVRALGADCFIGTPNIEYLDLSGNNFNGTPTSISRLKKLTTLLIEGNNLAFSLRPEVLSGLHELLNVSFSGTRIANWTGQFPPLPALRNLSLAFCGLTRLNASFRLPALQELRLEGNGLLALGADAFAHVPRLRRLQLSGNRLRQWPRLQRLRLAWLSLSNNSLAALAALGRAQVRVERLDVSRNAIARWDDDAVFGGGDGREAWVRWVNLSANSIQWLSAPMLSSLDALREVDLGANTLDCADCRTGALQAWLRSTRTRVPRPLLCVLPVALRGRPVQDAPFDAGACRDPRPRLWLGLGVPLGALLAAGAGGAALAFRFRTEVAYLAHLVRVRSTTRRRAHPATRTAHAHANAQDTLYDAFVCYSGKDRKFVMRRLARALERPPECFRLCLYDRDFRLGSHIVTNIVDAIDCSTKVVVVLTPHFIASKWCQWELEMAQHKLFSEDCEFLVLLELEPLERGGLPRLLRFLLETRPVVRWPRPETAAGVAAAAAQLRCALGPSLRQRDCAGDAARAHPPEQTPLLHEAQPAARL